MPHSSILFEPTTLTSVFTGLSEYLRARGIDPGELFRRAGLDVRRIGAPGARYPVRKINRLMRLVVETTGESCLALELVPHIRPATLHALGFAWLASPTITDALRRIERYTHVVSTVAETEIDRRPETTHLIQHFPHPRIQPTPWARETWFAFVVQMCRMMTNDSFAPLKVSFRHENHAAHDRFEAYFKCPVLNRADKDEMEFDNRLLDRFVPGSHPDVAAANDEVAEIYLASLNPHETATQVRQLLLEILPTGNACGDAVAARLNRSLSTLKRRLRDEGTTYKDVLDRTRKDLAIGYLNKGELSLAQIAYMLGFSDQASFSRAFKRWTGAAPGEFRTDATLH